MPGYYRHEYSKKGANGFAVVKEMVSLQMMHEGGTAGFTDFQDGAGAALLGRRSV
jgi:hypothetical protein